GFPGWLFSSQPCKGNFEFTEGLDLIPSIGRAEFEKCHSIKIVSRPGQYRHPISPADPKRTQLLREHPNIQYGGMRTGFTTINQNSIDLFPFADGHQFTQQFSAGVQVHLPRDICSHELTDGNHSQIICQLAPAPTGTAVAQQRKGMTTARNSPRPAA